MPAARSRSASRSCAAVGVRRERLPTSVRASVASSSRCRRRRARGQLRADPAGDHRAGARAGLVVGAVVPQLEQRRLARRRIRASVVHSCSSVRCISSALRAACSARNASPRSTRSSRVSSSSAQLARRVRIGVRELAIEIRGQVGRAVDADAADVLPAARALLALGRERIVAASDRPTYRTCRRRRDWPRRDRCSGRSACPRTDRDTSPRARRRARACPA